MAKHKVKPEVVPGATAYVYIGDGQITAMVLSRDGMYAQVEDVATGDVHEVRLDNVDVI